MSCLIAGTHKLNVGGSYSEVVNDITSEPIRQKMQFFPLILKTFTAQKIQLLSMHIYIWGLTLSMSVSLNLTDKAIPGVIFCLMHPFWI